MNARELVDALGEAAEAVNGATDQAAALSRLRRWARRETQFNQSPAALPVEDIAATRAEGIPAHHAGQRRRIHVHG